MNLFFFYLVRNPYQLKTIIFISIIPRLLVAEVKGYFVKLEAAVVFIRRSQEFARLEVLFMKILCPPMGPMSKFTRSVPTTHMRRPEKAQHLMGKSNVIVKAKRFDIRSF